ncbi:MAG: HU family DNA-binding protein [Patescibacteria group bacterium]
MAADKKAIAEMVMQKTQMTKKDSLELVDGIFDWIMNTMKKGEQVKIAGFGVFKVSKRAAREGINPKTGVKIHIPAKTAPKFRAAKQLKEAVL